MPASTKEVRLSLFIDAPDPSKTAAAFKQIGAAAKDAREHIDRLQLAQRDVGRLGFHGPPGTVAGLGYASSSQPLSTGPSSAIFQPYNARPNFSPPSASAYRQQSLWQGQAGLYFQGQMHQMMMHQMMTAAEVKQAPGAVVAPGAGHTPSGSAFGFEAAKMKGVAATAATLALVDTASRMTEAFQQLSNRFMTAREKLAGVYKSIPLVGDIFAGIADRALDAIERLKNPKLAKEVDEQRFTHARDIHFTTARGERQMGEYGLQREARESRNRGDVIGAFPTLETRDQAAAGVLGFGALGTAAVRTPHMQSAMEATQDARRELAIKRKNAADSDADVQKQKALYDATRKSTTIMEHRFNTAERESRDPIKGLVNTKELEKARMDYREALAKLEAERRKLEQMGGASKGNRLGVVEQQRTVSGLEIGEKRLRVDELQGRFEQARGGAQQFGAMDMFSQQGLLDAVSRFNKGGINNVTSQELDNLRSNGLTAGHVNRKLEQSVGDNDTYKAILKETGQQDAASIDQELVKAKAELNVQITTDAKELSDAFTKAMEDSNLKGILGGIISEKMRIAVEQFRTEQAVGAATGK